MHARVSCNCMQQKIVAQVLYPARLFSLGFATVLVTDRAITSRLSSAFLQPPFTQAQREGQCCSQNRGLYATSRHPHIAQQRRSVALQVCCSCSAHISLCKLAAALSASSIAVLRTWCQTPLNSQMFSLALRHSRRQACTRCSTSMSTMKIDLSAINGITAGVTFNIIPMASSLGRWVSASASKNSNTIIYHY